MSLNRPPLAPVAAAALALFTGACAMGAGLVGPTGPAAELVLPTEQYKPKVNQTPEQLALAPHAYGLSPAQAGAVGQFAQMWRDAGQGEVTIRTPSRGDMAAVSRATAATRAALEDLGVPRGTIAAEPYVAAPEDPAPPLLVSFLRYTAEVPDCTKGWDNLVSTRNNTPSTHFGCAVSANFAAEVANPRDLVQASPEQAADAARRGVVIDLYRKGQVTSSKRDEQATGIVSRAVQ